VPSASSIVDEAHHGVAESYRDVLDHFEPAARLGVTATPHRADGASLIPVFGRTVFRYPIRRAVRDGYLVDIRRQVVVLADLDLSKVRVRAGDFDAAELEAELTKVAAVAAVADAVLARVGTRPAVLFCAGILHSRAVAAALNARRPGSAAAASGDDRDGVQQLVGGQVQILCNTDLTTEGFDFPPLAFVGLVRPTKSVGRATQQVGRGTRLCEGKRDLLVTEFMGGAPSGQVSTVDVVGSDLPAPVKAAAERLLDASPSLSVLDALDRASAMAGSMFVRGGQKPRPVIDPMRLILQLEGMIMRPPVAGARAATAEQVQLLANEGLQVAGLDIQQASMLLTGIRWRRGRGRSTPAQALLLYSFGYDLECSTIEATRKLARMRAIGSAA
jgi:hypothetical protein